VASVTVKDESRPGRVLSELVLPDVPERLTLRELIRTRIREEVAIANLERATARHLLVRPRDAEVTLNGVRAPRTIDWEEQARIAEEAFEQNGFFVLVEGRQIDDLDEELTLGADSSVRFLRLTPLVGG
jgi:hypothetical protein